MSHGELPGATANQFPTQNIDTTRTDLFETEHGARLSAAIEGLYSAFADATLSFPLQYCSHCYTEADVRYIQFTPLRRLTTPDAAHILASVPHTLGTATDLNYFLPRVLETLAYQGHYMEHVLPETIALARSEGWKSNQVDAILEFMRAYVSAINAVEDNTSIYYGIDRMLENISLVLPELVGELDIRLNNPEATQQ
jgi:hypothetical protein